MKHGYLILSAAIAAALAGAPVLAQPVVANNVASPGGTGEMPRITQTINNQLVSPVAKTHLKFVETTAPAQSLADSFTMNHLQLVLKPSAARQAALTSLIADQHNPKSSRFQKWVSPEQFGETYGVVDGDVAAVTSWLKSQGFIVNNVYPNKTQIDFTGTAGQVKAAFRTQENVYNISTSGTDTEQHLANAGDISIPVALKDVVAGVMGLNDFQPQAPNAPIKAAAWDASKKAMVSGQPTASNKVGGTSQAISEESVGTNPQNAVRVLVPDDAATMYGINTIRANGVTGKGITIAVLDTGGMDSSVWANFVSTFNLAQYGGTFSQIAPAPSTGTNNCVDPAAVFGHELNAALALTGVEWSVAIAPGANIQLASCSSYTPTYAKTSSNYFGGVFIAGTNLINQTSGRPDIISAGLGWGEQVIDSASKTAVDQMWAQADAEGISVFVKTGESGSNPDFGISVINGSAHVTAVDANSLATSPNVTAVGGTDLADILDGTTSKYFAATPKAVGGGSALSYVPEIPWNSSCGNGVAAKSLGYASAIDFCNASFSYYQANEANPPPVPTSLMWYYPTVWETSAAGSGGPSSINRKPAWQSQVYNAAADQSRDIPDVALFAGSFAADTFVALCSSGPGCSTNFTPGTSFDTDPSNAFIMNGTGVSTAMFAGIQALIDQGLAARGMPKDQGNAAPTLYALAANEYGSAGKPNSASLSTCNADNGADGTSGCVFHNVTRGSISSACESMTGTGVYAPYGYTTPNCYYYTSYVSRSTSKGTETINLGLTTSDANPTSYTPANKAFSAQPGWSFASGLGSVNTTNLLIAWRAFVGAPPAP